MKAALIFLLTAVAATAYDGDWDWKSASVSELPKGVTPYNPEDPLDPLREVSIWKIDVDGTALPI